MEDCSDMQSAIHTLMLGTVLFGFALGAIAGFAFSARNFEKKLRQHIRETSGKE